MSDVMHTSEDPAWSQGPQAPSVSAYFTREVVAQEAIGLLVHHGFRPEAVRLRPVSVDEWTVVANRSADDGWGLRPALASLMVCVAGLLALAIGPPPSTARVVVTVLLTLLGSGGMAVLLAQTQRMAGTRVRRAPDPTGCVVSVRTLRVDDARAVLRRADGVALPSHPRDVAVREGE